MIFYVFTKKLLLKHQAILVFCIFTKCNQSKIHFMKKSILLFCVFFGIIQYSLSQNTFFQVKLNEGFHQIVETGDVYLNQINDNGFNQIISNNQGYIQPIQMSYKFSDELSLDFISVRPHPSMTSNTSTLYSQMSGYSTVVNTIFYNTTPSNYGDSVFGFAADRLNFTLVNPNNGSYLSTVESIVQTNNSELNTIFQNFSVNKYENGRIRCNCDVNNLKIALQNFTTVISNVFNVEFSGVYLNIPENTIPKSTLYPNPFKDNFSIETEREIIGYFIYNSQGAKIIGTSSKNDLDIKLKDLNSGFYFLELLFEKGQKERKKIIKE